MSLPDSITPGGTSRHARASRSRPIRRRSSTPTRCRFVDDTPEDAQRIVNRLAQVFVEENSRSREVRAQDTSQFIEAQLQASADAPERARRPGCGR